MGVFSDTAFAFQETWKPPGNKTGHSTELMTAVRAAHTSKSIWPINLLTASFIDPCWIDPCQAPPQGIKT